MVILLFLLSGKGNSVIKSAINEYIPLLKNNTWNILLPTLEKYVTN